MWTALWNGSKRANRHCPKVGRPFLDLLRIFHLEQEQENSLWKGRNKWDARALRLVEPTARRERVPTEIDALRAW
jgi:hypothetical protein